MALTPLKALKQTAKVLGALPCSYCLVGGHAASLYRTRERFTRDVDFALVGKPSSKSRAVAEQAIHALGLKSTEGFIPLGKQEKRRRSVCLISSAPAPGESAGIVDLLLPEIPWVTAAVRRAQENRIDLGIGMVPVITPEDLITAKCYSFRNSPDRFQDLDDLKEIFAAAKELDTDYLRSALAEHALKIPAPIKKLVPYRL